MASCQGAAALHETKKQTEINKLINSILPQKANDNKRSGLPAKRLKIIKQATAGQYELVVKDCLIRNNNNRDRSFALPQQCN